MLRDLVKFLLERQKEAVSEGGKQTSSRKPQAHVRQCECTHRENELRVTQERTSCDYSRTVAIIRRW